MDKAQKPRRVVVAVAPVGKDIEPPAINPLSPEAVAEEVIACARAGAGMVHLHVRNASGNQTEDLEAFSRTLDIIRASSDIIIQGSTGGLSTLTLEQRCVALNDSRVEVASLNMGSVNFGDAVYINTLPDIRYWAKRMNEARILPELEIFEGGMISIAEKLIEEGTLFPPHNFGFCLDFHHAVQADADSLLYLRNRLPHGARWGVVHESMTDFSVLAMAIGMGASLVRVGFEDSLFYAPGKAARKNVELVERVVALIRQIGIEVASPKEARRMIGLGSTAESG